MSGKRPAYLHNSSYRSRLSGLSVPGETPGSRKKIMRPLAQIKQRVSTSPDELEEHNYQQPPPTYYEEDLETDESEDYEGEDPGTSYNATHTPSATPYNATHVPSTTPYSATHAPSTTSYNASHASLPNPPKRPRRYYAAPTPQYSRAPKKMSVFTLGRKLRRYSGTGETDNMEYYRTVMEHCSPSLLDLQRVVPESFRLDPDVADFCVGISACLQKAIYDMEDAREQFMRAKHEFLKGKDVADLKEMGYNWTLVSDKKWSVKGVPGFVDHEDLKDFLLELYAEHHFTRKRSAFSEIHCVTRHILARILLPEAYKKFAIRRKRAMIKERIDFPQKVLMQLIGLHAEAMGVDGSESKCEIYEIEAATRDSVKLTLEDLRRSKPRIPVIAERRNKLVEGQRPEDGSFQQADQAPPRSSSS